MRCYLMRGGHIQAVELMGGLSDAAAIEKCRSVFEARKDRFKFDSFEVWDRARMLVQYPDVADDNTPTEPKS
jgi:hypothetical protein